MYSIVEVAGGPSLGQHQHRQTLQSVGNSHAAQGALQGAAFFNLAAIIYLAAKWAAPGFVPGGKDPHGS